MGSSIYSDGTSQNARKRPPFKQSTLLSGYVPILNLENVVMLDTRAKKEHEEEGEAGRLARGEAPGRGTSLSWGKEAPRNSTSEGVLLLSYCFRPPWAVLTPSPKPRWK